MLFSSYAFIFGFLPLSLMIFHGLRSLKLERCSIFALMALSLLFYGWWNPKYLLLLIPLTLANFYIAKAICQHRCTQPGTAKLIFIIGICGNLGVLGYFKYANFFIDNLNTLFGIDAPLAAIVLPLGISFFTFQKIAFLVDAYRGKLHDLNLLDFSLFVAFFPQLIAGPIVHHSEVLPQFKQYHGISGKLVTQGITLFTIGLAKKVLLADTVAMYATPQFEAVKAGMNLDILSAWSGALAYTAQLYFDFSGYSDMAIGAALLYGVRLPQNFASPYQATSIIDFWRRWHITLSRFLREYLYIPLGGNRHGRLRRHLNLFTTMLLGGLWHGAGWNFVIWGALHGLYLAINHSWRAIRPHMQWLPHPAGRIEVFVGSLSTFLAIVIGWVFFRAENLGAAIKMCEAMIGLNGLSGSVSTAHSLPIAIDSEMGLIASLSLLTLAWLSPNSQQLTRYIGPESIYCSGDTSLPVSSPWQPSGPWAAVVGVMFGLCIMSLSKVSEFLYFQF